MKRKIITIDEDKCNGCGLCVSACAEGAIQLVDGKAKLVSDNYCDGLGACLGECPQGAIAMIERDAAAFDEKEVEKHLKKQESKQPVQHKHAGCPGMAVMSFNSKDKNPDTGHTQDACAALNSELTQWPVQLHLVPPVAPYWENADLLICADCVPFAYANFHSELLKGRKLVIACPKLDDTDPYLEKLTAIFKENNIKSITVARMEVPCCGGIVMIAQRALLESGKDIPFKTITVGIHGNIIGG
ncbi:MAG TPA: 4Fe-4S ferredoxin [Lentisphaeria bacterium]|nr:MAG: 4Fe-4S ferredoxin [Lentisphaerae bacterium GWF2_50_93]HCE45394.1 4Fe-4S ferredoxin [Lentisphaeria bacterium]